MNEVMDNPASALEAQAIEFADPYEMLLFLDDNLLNGTDKLHRWQIDFMLDFAASEYSEKTPFKAAVRAANGSGKDKYIIAACVTWFAMRYPYAVAVVTSASGTQLDRQTCKYIQQLAEAANSKIGNVWKINYRHFECLASKATIELFVTDESGRAEGWHPIVNNGKLAIFVSEAKSVPDEIFQALARCHGFTHRVDVSSPGLPVGFFFDTCKGGYSVNRKLLKSALDAKGKWIEYHVTCYDCSHISQETIEEAKRSMPGGETGALFQSSMLAEFGTTDEMVVIPYTHIWKAVNRVNDTVGHLSEPMNTGGLDLSAGGDETVLSIRNGNKLLKVIPFRFDNTQDTVEFLVEQFKRYALDKPNAYIYADAGGLGKPIIDQLRSKGWSNIRYVLNQNKAFNERVYLNRGAEMWFNFGKLLETGEVWLCHDDKLIRQLATRYYKITENNKHKLESKLQARASGRPSPDRADSVVLCFSQYKSKLDQDDSAFRQSYPEPEPDYEEQAKQSPFTLREWAKKQDEGYFSNYERAYAKNDMRRLKRMVVEINNQVLADK